MAGCGKEGDGDKERLSGQPKSNNPSFNAVRVSEWTNRRTDSGVQPGAGIAQRKSGGDLTPPLVADLVNVVLGVIDVELARRRNQTRIVDHGL